MVTLYQNNQEKVIAGLYRYATSDVTVIPGPNTTSVSAKRWGNVVQIKFSGSYANGDTICYGIPVPALGEIYSGGVTATSSGSLTCGTAGAYANVVFTYLTGDN